MIGVTLHKQGSNGVDYDATLDEYLNDFVSVGFPYMVTDDQIVIIGELAGANTMIYVLDGDNMAYDLGTHTVSGELDEVTIGTLGDSYNSDGTFDTDAQDHITNYNEIVTYTGIDASNPAGVRGEFHEIVAELMYLGGSDARGAETFVDAIEDGGQNLSGSSRGDVFTGTNRDDVLSGMGGSDQLFGENGNDEIDGGNGGDTLEGGTGFDTIHGGGGNDEISGNREADQLYGEAGRDTIYGGNGNDTIWGGNDNDRLFGQDGRDTLYGGNGNDTLNGGDDIDVLDGGAGRDKLFGGGGNDTFVFSAASEADRDKIYDFDLGGNETIDLSAIDANTGANGNQAFTFIGEDTFSGTPGELRIVEKPSNTLIRGDVDGDGGTDFLIVVVNYHGITGADFDL